jgi:hypothetical protein
LPVELREASLGSRIAVDMMRKALTLTLALGWAACFLVQATYVPVHPALGIEAAGAPVAALAAFAHVAVGGMFLWLISCLISERPAEILMPFADWLRLTFAVATVATFLYALSALPSGHHGLLGVAFLQLAALLASYIVTAREARVPPPLDAANDNIPLAARVMAWNASRNALFDHLTPRFGAMRGERR